MSQREMYEQVNALVGTIALALDIEATEAARAVEAGDLVVVAMDEDERGRFLIVTYGDKVARIYQGAILR